MKSQLITVLAAVMIITLGIQIYLVAQLNDRLNQDDRGIRSEKNLPKQPGVTLPKSGLDGKFFKDQPWSPYEEVQRMQSEMDRIFSDSFSRFHLNTPLGSLSKTPEVDLQENSDHYMVTVNVPGADESSLDVKLEDRQLHISIKTEHSQDKSDDNYGQYSYRERFMGKFQRVLTLPGPANAAKMTTDYHNGVLTITIPKD